MLARILGPLLLTALPVPAAEPPMEEKERTPRVWTNSAELGVVLTTGNSKSETVAFKDTLKRTWPSARFRLQLDGTVANTADDPFAIVDCQGGDPQTCLDDLVANPPADTNDVPFVVIVPEVEPDVEKYFVEARYDREIGKRLFWNVGASWFRDLDAGILNRYVAFAGVGNLWYDREDLKFNTTYGLSFTDREEEEPDPEKEERFPGVRFEWEYMNLWGKVTTYTNEWSFNVSIADPSDFSSAMTNGLAVKMSRILALKVSWTVFYNNEPALEDIDLYFGEGQSIELGEVNIRKQKVDTVFSTSLVVTF